MRSGDRAQITPRTTWALPHLHSLLTPPGLSLAWQQGRGGRRSRFVAIRSRTMPLFVRGLRGRSAGLRSATRAVRWMLPGVALLMCAACRQEGEVVTISGDVPGLDTIALRGDSLLARADRPPEGIFDTAFTPRPHVGEVTATASGNGTLEPASAALASGAEITRRAQARGDSIARAYAAQLAGGNADGSRARSDSVGGGRGGGRGCGGPGGGGNAVGSRARSDSVRGVVATIGSVDAPQVVVRVGTATYAVSGMATRGMLRLVGNEVVVRGVKVSPRDIVVADYIVRAARGLPVLDGTIGDDGALHLTDGSGIKHVALPAEVRALVGTRVWIAMRGSNAAAFGIVTTR